MRETVGLYIRLLDRSYQKVNPKAKTQPEGTYHLRYQQNGKRLWRAVAGNDLNLAIACQKRQEAALLTATPMQPRPEAETRLTVDEAIAEYLTDMFDTKAPKTHGGSKRTLARFRQSCRREFLEDITEWDLQNFVRFLRTEDLSNRTIFNIFQGVNSFLRVHKILLGTSILKKLGGEYDTKIVTAYTKEEIAALFAACDEEERMVWEFFLTSGCREGEVAHTEWGDLDFTKCTLHVQPKPERGWKPKDREDRFVPLPRELMAKLQAKRNGAAANALVFPNGRGGVEGHFLRRLKLAGRRAGIESSLELHKFRKSFACWHSDNNVPVRALQGWLGHSSLVVTMSYLRGTEAGSETAQAAANSTFAVALARPHTRRQDNLVLGQTGLR
jgi:integrase/recombinase XerD